MVSEVLFFIDIGDAGLSVGGTAERVWLAEEWAGRGRLMEEGGAERVAKDREGDGRSARGAAGSGGENGGWNGFCEGVCV